MNSTESHSTLSLNAFMKKQGIKYACLRYDGADGRGDITNVNFMSQAGRFMTSRDIVDTQLPEKEFYAIGHHILDRAAPGWMLDRGSRGQITWPPEADIIIQHETRSSSFVPVSQRFPAKAVAVTVKEVGIPPSEVRNLKAINAEFHADPETILVANICALDLDDLSCHLSQAASTGTSSLFKRVIHVAINAAFEDAEKDMASVSGRVSWEMGSEITIEAQAERVSSKNETITLSKEEIISL